MDNPFEYLHTYWRMEYVQAIKNNDTDKLFAELPKTDNDEEALIILRDQYTYLVLNRFPYNPGHLLLVPYREVPDLKDLSNEERLEFFNNIIRAQDILTKALKPHGFNIGFNLGKAAGAGIPNHLHGHIVPRWTGDTNFMPVIGHTKTLATSLGLMWKQLKAHC